MNGLIFLAQSAIGDVPPLVGYGLLGWALGTLAWFAWRTINRAEARAERGDGEIKRLNSYIAESAIPALQKGAIAVETSAAGQRELIAVVAGLQRDLDGLQRELVILIQRLKDQSP